MITYFNDIAIIENDLISGWVKEHGRLDFDNNSLPQLLKYIKEGDNVIDAGAFVGDHTIAYANKVGSCGNIFAIEPNPIAFECLKHNMRNSPHVQIFNFALSDESDHNNYIIDYNDTNVGASYLREKEKGSNFTSTIDRLNVTANFIKIDCEGFEYRILQGAKKTIEKFKPVLCLEINEAALERQGHTPQMVFDFLNEMNYIYRNIYEEQPMGGLQYDILCFPK